MLGVKSLDYNNYYVALKGNYRKGVHRLRGILENPTVAQEFAENLGGVSVVLGWPIGNDDKNSAELLALLQTSSVIDTAALTWVSQWYEDYADDWDTLASNLDRSTEIAGDALLWRGVGSSPVGAAKVIATLAGLSCGDYDDMTALAASSTAMTAVIANSTALNAVVSSSTAMTAVAASSTAMTAVAASSTAMAAVAASSTARNAVTSSSAAMTALASSPLKKSFAASYSAHSNNAYQYYTGNAFVINFSGSGSGSATWAFSTLYNGSATSVSSTTYTGTSGTVNKFAKNITIQHGGGSTSDSITVYYIPC